MWHKFFSLLLLLTLAGCDRSGPEALLNNYSERVSRVLEVESPPLALSSVPAFPPRRSRILPTESLREGLLDVLQLKQCGMLTLIAERNSSLGKVYTPASRLLYELRFYQQIHQCYTTLQQASAPDPELLLQVSHIVAVKQRNLSLELWNGLYTAAEMEQHFARNAAPLKIGAPPLPAAALATIQVTVQRTLAGKPLNEITLEQLTNSFAALHASDAGASLLQSLKLLTAYLQQVSESIEQRLKDKPMCLQGRPTPQADILHNVFRKYYAGDVQPYMALVQRQGEPWFNLHQIILSAFAEQGQLPAAMHQYQQRLTALWQQYIQARNNHTQSWQKILRQCGLMPSNNS
ncbi:DUF3080 family protein [Pontibacter sp. JAM-7]|uniref:DUF3080 family protein n=1 Tax=Pontibacter sp. JAM-7 TaxID=3366581 RepID=UPI003AF7FD00